MVYELWDADTRNIIYIYPTEAAAFAEQVAAYGRDAVAGWALLRNDGTEGKQELRWIADGEIPADRALRAPMPEPIQHTAD